MVYELAPLQFCAASGECKMPVLALRFLFLHTFKPVTSFGCVILVIAIDLRACHQAGVKNSLQAGNDGCMQWRKAKVNEQIVPEFPQVNAQLQGGQRESRSHQTFTHDCAQRRDLDSVRREAGQSEMVHCAIPTL